MGQGGRKGQMAKRSEGVASCGAEQDSGSLRGQEEVLGMAPARGAAWRAPASCSVQWSQHTHPMGAHCSQLRQALRSDWAQGESLRVGCVGCGPVARLRAGGQGAELDHQVVGAGLGS